MTLIRIRPSAINMHSFEQDVTRLFDQLNVRTPQYSDAPAFYAPAVDIEETTEEFQIRVDLPGIAQQDVKVSLLGETLTIRGERKTESKPTPANMHRTERVQGAFERAFTLPSPVRSDGVVATYRDGVLEIHVPKAEHAKVREIEVKAG